MLYDIPFPAWSVSKFAARYGLDPEVDFYITGEGKLFVSFTLPDFPPIFEPQDPPQAQGRIFWEAGSDPGTVALIAEFDGKQSIVVDRVGAEFDRVASYQSPGPKQVPPPLSPRREFHLLEPPDLALITTPITDGDVVYFENGSEYRFQNGEWKRILTGPSLGSPGDIPDLYAGLEMALDDALSGIGAPPIHPKVLAVLTELRKLL